MKTKEAMDLVDKGLKTLTDALAAGKSENLKAFLRVAANFHNYSLNNWCLIFSQCPHATRVAGYKTWQNLGRQVVKKGGIKILAPRTYKKKDTEAGEDTGKKNIYFATVTVFDISLTEGDDLPSVFKVEGDPGEYLGILEELVDDLGIELTWEDGHLCGALGVSKGGAISVLSSIEPAQRFTTLVHELAHELLHRTEDRASLSKQQKETEAEAVSYVVGQAIGVDSLGQTADYTHLWGGDMEIFTKHLGRIQKCAKTILEGLKKKEAECKSLGAT